MPREALCIVSFRPMPPPPPPAIRTPLFFLSSRAWSGLMNALLRPPPLAEMIWPNGVEGKLSAS